MYCLKKATENIKQNRVMLPSKIKCLGCRTYFIEQQTLYLENLFVQFKNYRDIPVIEPKHQQILLRTIVAFLNAKGGVIYMGVEDQKCSVVGNSITKNKQEQFRKLIKQLCQNIYPEVNKKTGMVEICFVPVMKRNGMFTGKYVTKVIVMQGRTDILYTIGNKMSAFITHDPTQKTTVDLRVGYVRIGAGGNSKLEDVHMYEQIYRRSQDPNDIVKIHQGCHPPPKQGNLQIKILGFKIEKAQVQKLASHIAKIYFKLKIPVQNIKQNYVGLKRLYTVSFKTSNDADKVLEKFVDSQQQKDLLRQLKYILQGIEDGMYLFVAGDKYSGSRQLIFERVPQPVKEQKTPRTRWRSDFEDSDEEIQTSRHQFDERSFYERQFDKRKYENQFYGEEQQQRYQINRMQRNEKQRNIERRFEESKREQLRYKDRKQDYSSEQKQFTAQKKAIYKQKQIQIQSSKIQKEIIQSQQIATQNDIKPKVHKIYKTKITIVQQAKIPKVPQTKQYTKQQVPQQKPIQIIQQISSKQLVKKPQYYQFTHVLRGRVQDLSKHLHSASIFDKKANHYIFKQSLLIQIHSTQIKKIKQILWARKDDLSQFGYNGILIHGKANGHVFVQDYKQSKVQLLLGDIKNQYLKNTKVKSIQTMTRKNNYTYLDIEIQEQRQAAVALDTLIEAKALRKYQCGQNKRLKILLQHD